MQTLRYALDADGIATVTFDEPGSPVNTMCIAWQDDLGELVEQVQADLPNIRGIVLASAKPTFFAGADLKAVMRIREVDAVLVFEQVERMKRHFRTLETLGRPVVAIERASAE